MIDSIVRASLGTIQYLVKDYFILNTIFNQNMDVNVEFQRTFEHNNVKDMKFLDSQVDGRAVLVYNRDPVILSTEQRVTRRQVHYESSDIKKSEFRDFFIGDISINCKIGTNVPEALFIFESLYNIKLFGNKDVEVKIIKNSVRFHGELQRCIKWETMYLRLIRVRQARVPFFLISTAIL
jgi:hypothetical protein